MINLIVYGSMALLLAMAVFGFLWKGRGLRRLGRLTRELHEAAQILENEAEVNELREWILDKYKGGNPQEMLFQDATLRSRMALYVENVRDIVAGIQVRERHKSLRDIGEFFDDDLLEQQCSSRFIGYACSGLTALGMLGTFLGLTSGLEGLQIGSSEEIIASVSVLLGGMNVAFVTSIVGIILSLVLGIWHHRARSGAEEAMDEFVTNFRVRVLGDHTEQAMNDLMEQLQKIENSLTSYNETQIHMLNKLAGTFAQRISEILNLQIQTLGKTMTDTTDAQKGYNESVKTMTGALNKMTSQNEKLADAIERMDGSVSVLAAAVGGAGETTNKLLADQVKVTEEMAKVGERMNTVSEGVTVQAEKTANAVKNTSDAAEDAANVNIRLMNSVHTMMQDYTDTLTNAVKAQQAALEAQVNASIQQIVKYTDQAVNNLPQPVDNTALLEKLIDQNTALLQKQDAMIKALGGKPVKKKGLFRKVGKA